MDHTKKWVWEWISSVEKLTWIQERKGVVPFLRGVGLWHSCICRRGREHFVVIVITILQLYHLRATGLWCIFSHHRWGWWKLKKWRSFVVTFVVTLPWRGQHSSRSVLGLETIVGVEYCMRHVGRREVTKRE